MIPTIAHPIAGEAILVAHSAAELAELLNRHVTHHHKIGQNLLNNEAVSAVALREALQIQRTTPNKRLGDILVDMGAASITAVRRALVEELDVPRVSLAAFDLDPRACALLTPDLALGLEALPLMFDGDNLVLAVHNLPQVHELELLRFTAAHPIRLVLASRTELQQALDKQYKAKPDAARLADLNFVPASGVEENKVWKDAEALANQAPLVQLVDTIIQDAIARHASDIHLRPAEHEVELLYRVDGALARIRQYPRALLPAIVSRIKIMSGLNIAEHRLPQDGRVRVKSGTQTIDLRISVIPVQYGESIVIRILDKNQSMRSIEQIGFSDADREKFLDLLKRSYGILLVTGPTGSGKSTTLYAALQELVRPGDANIVTVEDPIEYELAGTRQIQALPQIGFTFAEALRHILRHDPDVVMIGEMRDAETCKIAIESALTGHLVLSTLHTNDAPSTLTRLMEIGIAPYMIRSSVIGVLAQRLVRRNCPDCLAEEQVPPLMRKNLNLGPDEAFYRGTGCPACHHTGFHGRLAIYELLALNDSLRDQIVPGVSSDSFRESAIANGMTPIQQDGLVKARQKLISIAELYRACM